MIAQALRSGAKPALSVIVPCLNEEENIAATLAALAPMRSRGVEVIVVDGGSSDRTVARARDKADAVITAPRGRALQMNAGAARARGDVLLFLHADSRLPPHADHIVLERLAQSGRSWGRFDVAIDGRHRLLQIVSLAMNLRSRWTGIATGDQAIFVKRTLFERIGAYPSIALMEDVALSKRLKQHSRPLCISAQVTTSARRWEKHGVIRTVLLMWRLRLAYSLGADPNRLAGRYVPHK